MSKKEKEAAIDQGLGEASSDFFKMPDACIHLQELSENQRHRPIVFIGNQGIREYASCLEYLFPDKIVIVGNSGDILSTIEMIKNDVLPLDPSVVVL